jgi:hypothetical protein
LDNDFIAPANGNIPHADRYRLRSLEHSPYILLTKENPPVNRVLLELAG